MQLFAGSSHPALAESLAKALKVSLGKITLKDFSCGEQYVKFEESIRGKDVYILQTSTHEPDKDLIQLYLMCQAAQLSFAETIHVIVPHFPYARQDRVAEPREPISAKLVAHLLEEAGADHVITMDLHSSQIQGFFSIPVDGLDARRIFAEYFLGKKLKKPVVVSPDAGGAKRAKKFADIIGAELAILNKIRPKHQEVEIMEIVGNIDGKTCILFDDMIDTAGSFVSAKQVLIDNGANEEMYAAATHAILSGKAMQNLKKANFTEVVVTDSTPVNTEGDFPLTILPIAPMLAEVINHIERGESVTDIYEKK